MDPITSLLELLTMTVVVAYIPPQPKTNVWVTMANLTGQDTICLVLSSPDNPFSTCLVGLPLDAWPCPKQIPTCNSSNPNTTVDQWDAWIPYLPLALTEPQELELLGSVKMDACLIFNWSSQFEKTNGSAFNMNSSLLIYRNSRAWCLYLSKNVSK